MEGPLLLLLVAGLLAALLPATAATFGPQPGAPCEPTLLATQVSLFCAPDMPTAQCCEPVVAAVDLGGGVPCLCRVAAEPQLVTTSLNATHLLTLYSSCGGLRPGGAHLAAACEGPTPSAAVVIALPPSPALPAPHLMQPTHEAPPLPPSTEKTSLRAAHSKAAPTYPATSPLAAAAIPLSVPQPPNSGSSSQGVYNAGSERPARPAAVPIAPPPSPASRRKQPAQEAFSRPWLDLKLSNQMRKDSYLQSSSQQACPSALELGTLVAVQCGLGISDAGCCKVLAHAIERNNALSCMCMLASVDAVKQVQLTVRDILRSYAGCGHKLPLHLPFRGCSAVLDTPPASSIPAPPPHEAPSVVEAPPVGISEIPTSPLAAIRVSPSASSAPLAPKRKDGLLVFIIAASFTVAIVTIITTAALFWRKGHGGFMRMEALHVEGGTDAANECEMVAACTDVAEDGTATGPILPLRRSPRLAGELAGPGLTDKTKAQ